jgi:hypothetical protein
MHLHLLGFLGWAVPDPINVGKLFHAMGVLTLSWWVGHLPTPPATSAFIISIIPSMLAFFMAFIAVICLLCCSCSIANNIACNSLLSSAAAVSCVRSTASLKRHCLDIVAGYCLRSSHFLMKYVWSLAHVCCVAVLFFHRTTWSSVNILLCHICAPAAIIFSASLVDMPQSPSDT